jgi:hypothetical protein
VSEFNFGLGRGRLSAKDRRRVDAIAEKHGASFTNPRLPGDGDRYWFSGPNRGEPFDGQLARRVLAAVDAAGITLPGPGRPLLPEGEGATALLRVRCRPGQKSRWEEKAGGDGALSGWVCETLDKAARR